MKERDKVILEFVGERGSSYLPEVASNDGFFWLVEKMKANPLWDQFSRSLSWELIDPEFFANAVYKFICNLGKETTADWQFYSDL